MHVSQQRFAMRPARRTVVRLALSAKKQATRARRRLTETSLKSIVQGRSNSTHQNLSSSRPLSSLALIYAPRSQPNPPRAAQRRTTDGLLSSETNNTLLGCHKPSYMPHRCRHDKNNNNAYLYYAGCLLHTTTFARPLLSWGFRFFLIQRRLESRHLATKNGQLRTDRLVWAHAGVLGR